MNLDMPSQHVPALLVTLVNLCGSQRISIVNFRGPYIPFNIHAMALLNQNNKKCIKMDNYLKWYLI